MRAAHLDPTQGFFNGPSVFLAALGRKPGPCLVEIRAPEGRAFSGWKVATTLAPAHGKKGAARAGGFGLYRADDYDELIDHPIEMGRFTHTHFECGGRAPRVFPHLERQAH